MAKQELTNSQKKEWAKELFIKDEYTQKQIAQKVDVAEKTISKWVNDGKWDTLRKTTLTSKQEIMRDLYSILSAMKAEAKKAAEDGDPGTKPDSDGILKITAAIKNLEQKTGTGDMIQTGIEFIKFVQPEDLELAKKFTYWLDLFIQSRLNKF